jgi:hypothetical protein
MTLSIMIISLITPSIMTLSIMIYDNE